MSDVQEIWLYPFFFVCVLYLASRGFVGWWVSLSGVIFFFEVFVWSGMFVLCCFGFYCLCYELYFVMVSSVVWSWLFDCWFWSGGYFPNFLWILVFEGSRLYHWSLGLRVVVGLTVIRTFLGRRASHGIFSYGPCIIKCGGPRELSKNPPDNITQYGFWSWRF